VNSAPNLSQSRKDLWPPHNDKDRALSNGQSTRHRKRRLKVSGHQSAVRNSLEAISPEQQERAASHGLSGGGPRDVLHAVLAAGGGVVHRLHLDPLQELPDL
jgi:hypothetical protein